MIHFQTTLRQLCSPISTCSMDPEPFRKFLSSTKLYATGTEVFATATLAGLERSTSPEGAGMVR